MLRHPSKKALRAWLAGSDDEAVNAHLLSCERCATTLENLDEPITDGAISSALNMVLAPPTDLSQRLEQRVAERLDSRQVLGYVADLFGAGMETTRVLFVDDPADSLPGSSPPESSPPESSPPDDRPDRPT